MKYANWCRLRGGVFRDVGGEHAPGRALAEHGHDSRPVLGHRLDLLKILVRQTAQEVLQSLDPLKRERGRGRVHTADL